VWQRTLEIFDLMGLPVADYLASSVTFENRVYHVLDLEPISIGMAQPGTRFPLPLLVGQQVTEQMLTSHLAGLGVTVTRGAKAVSVAECGSRVRVGINTTDGAEQTVWASWVVVAEGSHSTLRAELGIPWSSTHFPGALLQVDAFVDGQMPGSPADAHLFLGLGGTFGNLPLPDGRRRLFLSVPDRDPGVKSDPPVAEIEPLVRAFIRRPSVRLVGGQFNWRVRFHNSISETFQRGRCLLIGDSARTFMPVAAQGMNTGIQDAFNLGWKLAAVVRGHAGETLLSSYAAERHPVAVEALKRAEKGLWSGVGQPPPLAEVMEGIDKQRTRRTALALSYGTGPLAKDVLGTHGAMAGDRAPDLLAADGRTTALYQRLRHGNWTLLVFPPGPEPHQDPRRDAEIPVASSVGEAARACPDSLRVLLMGEARVPGHVNAEQYADPGGAARSAYGADGGALCLVRPDGHIGFRGDLHAGPDLIRYLRHVAA
jgi:2-polyprenyl-6-methoxyphenol hydroxylase-like FAD-dependent oxidoreductase